MIVLVLLIICVLAFLMLNILYRRTNAFKNTLSDVVKYKFWPSGTDKMDIVNIGSNHPKYAFDWSVTSLKGENCAVGPQAFEYDYAVLRYVTPALANGSIVVIPICLLNFYLYRFDARSNYYKYYTFLDKKDIHDYSWAEKLLHIQCPLLSNPLLAVRIFRDVSKDVSLSQTKNQLSSEIELDADANKWYEGWEQQFKIKISNPVPSKKNLEDIQQNIMILKEILLYCKSNGYKPVISILPVTDYLSSKFTERFIQEQIICYIEEANVVGAPVLNYLNDERFSSSEYYINSFFFNKKGRELFTKQFVEDLRAQSIL